MWLCHMSRWDRYVLRPRVRAETSGSETVPHIGPYNSINPSIHLLKLTELCELFKISGLTRGEVMKKLFALSLKGKALEWYRLLDDSHLRDWEEIQSLFYSKFYPLHEVHENRNYIYNFYPHDG